MQVGKGVLYTVLSAVIFGFTPILAKLAYAGGANGITIAFLRAAISLPILFALMKARRVPLGITRRQGRDAAILGTLGTAASALLLYSSYNYIGVGLATALHFVYPLLVTVAYAFLKKERLSPLKCAALLLGTAAVLLSLDISGGTSGVGAALSLLSGVTYAFYMVFMDLSGLKELHPFKLTFYTGAAMSLATLCYGAAAGALTLRITPTAWLFACIISVTTTVGAFSLLQLGVKLAGPSNAAIASATEPLVGVVLSAAILGEAVTQRKAAGVALIVASIVFVALAGAPPRTERKTDGLQRH